METPSVHRRAAALAALALAACAGARTPGAARPSVRGEGRRVFSVPGHGALEITVPPGWKAEAGEDTGDPPAPATIRLEQPGGPFLALLTPFWDPGEDDEVAHGDTARLFAELARRNALAESLERELPLHELGGLGVHGFWFRATDRELVGKEPGPEEWRHVMQGAAAVGTLVVAFTLLDNAPGPQREVLLEVVRGARHLPEVEEERGAAGGMVIDPDAQTVPLEVEVRGRPWSVLVDLPGFRMFRPRRGEEGVGALVFGQHPASGIVVSVILRAAADAPDAAGCREADLGRIHEAVPELAELRLGADGAAARASYAVTSSEAEPVRQEHGHAWLHREGVCANVHVSKMAPAPADAEALERILASVRFGERL